MKIISCCSCSLINSFTWVYLLSFSLNIQERLLSLQTQQSIPTIQTWLALILPQQLPSVISLASDTSGGTGPFVDQSLFPAPPSSAPPPGATQKDFVVEQRCSLTRESERPGHGKECLALPALWTCCCLKALWMVRCMWGVWREPGPQRDSSSHRAHSTSLTLSTLSIRRSNKGYLIKL